MVIWEETSPPLFPHSDLGPHYIPLSQTDLHKNKEFDNQEWKKGSKEEEELGFLGD